MYKKKPVINEKYVMEYMNYLREQERSRATLKKYLHDLKTLITFLNGDELTKAALINWKESLMTQYAPASVNSMIAAANGYVKYKGWYEKKA